MIAPQLRTTREDADRARLAEQIESGALTPLLAELSALSAARRRLVADAAGFPDDNESPPLGDLRQPSYWLASIAAIMEHQTAVLLDAIRPQPRAPLFLVGLSLGLLLGTLIGLLLN